MKYKAPLIAAAAGAAVFSVGQSYWNRRALLDRGGGGAGYADKGFFTQLWEATPNLTRTATVGILGGLAAFYAAKRLA